jgi:hypothetical protein
MTALNRIRAAAAAVVLAAVVTGSAIAATTAKPIISTFSPSKAKPLATITLHGKNLTGTKTVTVDGTKATFKVSSATKITIAVPKKAKTGKIALTTAGGTVISAHSLTIS